MPLSKPKGQKSTVVSTPSCPSRDKPSFTEAAGGKTRPGG